MPIMLAKQKAKDDPNTANLKRRCIDKQLLDVADVLNLPEDDNVALGMLCFQLGGLLENNALGEITHKIFEEMDEEEKNEYITCVDDYKTSCDVMRKQLHEKSDLLDSQIRTPAPIWVEERRAARGRHPERDDKSSGDETERWASEPDHTVRAPPKKTAAKKGGKKAVPKKAAAKKVVSKNPAPARVDDDDNSTFDERDDDKDKSANARVVLNVPVPVASVPALVLKSASPVIKPTAPVASAPALVLKSTSPVMKTTEAVLKTTVPPPVVRSTGPVILTTPPPPVVRPTARPPVIDIPAAPTANLNSSTGHVRFKPSLEKTSPESSNPVEPAIITPIRKTVPPVPASGASKAEAIVINDDEIPLPPTKKWPPSRAQQYTEKLKKWITSLENGNIHRYEPDLSKMASENTTPQESFGDFMRRLNSAKTLDDLDKLYQDTTTSYKSGKQSLASVRLVKKRNIGRRAWEMIQAGLIENFSRKPTGVKKGDLYHAFQFYLLCKEYPSLPFLRGYLIGFHMYIPRKTLRDALNKSTVRDAFKVVVD